MQRSIARGGGAASIGERDRRTLTWLAALLSGALVFRLTLVLLLRNRPTHDLRIFISWAHLFERYGSHGLYRHVDTIDHFPVNYPPLFAVVLGAVDAIYQRFVRHGGQDPVLLEMLLKLPAIGADIVICACVFIIVRRWAGEAAALAAVGIAAFAPSTWPISAVWGQVDSVCTMFMVIALLFAFRRHYTVAWIALVLAVLVKPLPVVVAPLLLVSQLRDQGWSWRMLSGPGSGAVLAYIIALPFAPTAAPVGVFRWLAGQYAAGQSLSDSTSVNAYNIWTLTSTVTTDSRLALGVTLHAWGWLVFSIILAATSWRLVLRLSREQRQVVRERLIMRAWFIVLMGLFLFQTRMHERYVLFALALAPLMWFCGRRDRWGAFLITINFTICVVLVLGFYEHSWFKEVVPVTRLLSLLNLSAFAVILLSFFTERGAATGACPGTQKPDEIRDAWAFPPSVNME